MNHIRKILQYLLVILVILQCYSLLVMITPNRYFYIAILVIFAVLLMTERSIIMKKNMYVVIGYVAISLSILLLDSRYRNFEYICSCMAVFFLAFIYLSLKDNLLSVLECYRNIMLIIVSLSLFFFVFASLLDVIKPTGYYPYSVVGWGSNNYYDYFHLYCEGQSVRALGYVGVRNIALFLEGPMLSYTLSIALYYELFLRREGFSRLALVIMSLTMLSSFSTTGLLVLAILLYCKFNEKIKRSRYIRFLLIPITFALVIFVMFYIIQDKLNSNVYSSATRMEDIIATLKCFIHNPISGIGYQNLRGINQYRTIYRTRMGLSSGLGGVLAFGGMLWGMTFIIPYIIAVKGFVVSSEKRRQLGFVFLTGALLVVTVVQTRCLCTIVNTICWLIVMGNFDDNLISKTSVRRCI